MSTNNPEKPDSIRRIAHRDGTTTLRVQANNPSAAIVDQTGAAHAQNREQRRANMRLVSKAVDADMRARMRPILEQLQAQPYAVRLRSAASVRAIAQTTSMSAKTRTWMLSQVAELQRPD